MANTLRKYQRLIQRLQNLQNSVARSQGSLEQIQTQLRKDHKCESIKDTEKLAASLQKQESKLEQQFNKALVEFEEMVK